MDVEDRDDSVWHNLSPFDGGLSGWRLLWDRYCPIPSWRYGLKLPRYQQVSCALFLQGTVRQHCRGTAPLCLAVAFRLSQRFCKPSCGNTAAWLAAAFRMHLSYLKLRPQAARCRQVSCHMGPTQLQSSSDSILPFPAGSAAQGPELQEWCPN